ncbi:hypothetical protein RZS08_22445, partial [Arthrospira platensis SPKY1]|nr:hypothetical protein [Arthrospira platensis SPKY1]
VVLELGRAGRQHQGTVAGSQVRDRSRSGLPKPRPHQPHVGRPGTGILERFGGVVEQTGRGGRVLDHTSEGTGTRLLADRVERRADPIEQTGDERPQELIARFDLGSGRGRQPQPPRRDARTGDRQKIGREGRPGPARSLGGGARAPG